MLTEVPGRQKHAFDRTMDSHSRSGHCLPGHKGEINEDNNRRRGMPGRNPCRLRLEPGALCRAPRIVLFYRGELRGFLRQSLSEHGRSTSRELATRLVALEGKDGRDRRMMNDIVKRMGKALRQMQDSGIIARSAEKVRGEYVWRAV